MCLGRGRNRVQGFNSLEEHRGEISGHGATLMEIGKE